MDQEQSGAKPIGARAALVQALAGILRSRKPIRATPPRRDSGGRRRRRSRATDQLTQTGGRLRPLPTKPQRRNPMKKLLIAASLAALIPKCQGRRYLFRVWYRNKHLHRVFAPATRRTRTHGCYCVDQRCVDRNEHGPITGQQKRQRRRQAR
jgi:hypothetical protein